MAGQGDDGDSAWHRAEAGNGALLAALERIAAALERMAPEPPAPSLLPAADAFVWRAANRRLEPIAAVAETPLALLKGIDRQKALLLDNTERFADGYPANNALLWGARGVGKSSVVKAVVRDVAARAPLKLIEIHREDIESLGDLLATLRRSPEHKVVLFCDDLSFDTPDRAFRSLKVILEGGLEGRPANVLIYATSNRRHLTPREAIENEQREALLPGETVEEKVSLSDRFGLWLGFHALGQEAYLDIVAGYSQHYGLQVDPEVLRAEALAWAAGRGARSGRVAWQFIEDLAGRSRIRLR